MKPSHFLGAAALTAMCAMPAAAQDRSSYVFGYGGAIFDGDIGYAGTITPPGGTQSVDVGLDNGYQFGLGLGRHFQSWDRGQFAFRGEIELSFSDTDAGDIFFSGNGPAGEVNVAGGIRTTALFGNVFADFKSNGAVTPFVGAGLGIADIRQNLVYGPGVRIDESDTVFGAQLIAGAAWKASDRVTLTADVRYRRYFGVRSNRFLPTGASSGVVDGDLSTTSFNIGARIEF